MNSHSHIKNIFKLLFDIRKINIAFYDKGAHIFIDHIHRDNHHVLPLNSPDTLVFHDDFSTAELICPNNIETYLAVPCDNSHISGIFIWGPFSMDHSFHHSAKNIMNDLLITPDRYDRVRDYISTIPFVPHDELKLLKSSTLGLASLSPEDIDGEIVNKPKFHEKSPSTRTTKEDSIIHIWQNNISYTDLKDSQKFFRDLFKSKNREESIHVLQSYVYISKPFDYISLDKYCNHVESLRSVLLIILGITMTNAISYGMDNYTNINLSLEFGLQIRACSSIEELITIRNKMFLSYSEKFYPSKFKEYSKLTQNIMSFIKDNILKKITVNDLALEMNYSPSYLSHYFKVETGTTIKGYILSKKIDLSKEMLAGSNISISDLSDYLSFSSYNHFSSLFKKHTGLSPKEYRSSLESKDL